MLLGLPKLQSSGNLKLKEAGEGTRQLTYISYIRFTFSAPIPWNGVKIGICQKHSVIDFYDKF